LGCQPAALYPYVQSKGHLLDIVAQLVERKLTRAMFPVATSATGDGAQDKVVQAVEAFLRFARQESNLWELLFVYAGAARVGQRARLALERRLASALEHRSVTADAARINAPASARLIVTVAIGAGVIRVCRPGLIVNRRRRRLLICFCNAPRKGE
jgi:hypothetical protein